MAMSIRNPMVERMARELAKRKGATMTEAIADALEASLASQDEACAPRRAVLAEIAAECAGLPDLDKRSADEILGYGETGGLPMVIDSSALLAVLFGLPEAEDNVRALASSGRKFKSAVNKLETMIVVEARKGMVGTGVLARLLTMAGMEIIPFDSSQAEIAMAAWRRYGKGRHPAGLDLGDCAAYALASTLNDSLLFKGGDFSETDAIPA